jgi:hypothetical protein
MALGLTNVILKGLVRRGWVQVVHAGGSVRYVITSEGIAEKTRISRAYFAYTTRFYVEARARVLERLTHLSDTWHVPAGPHGKRVAFYGAGEVGEIGYVCMQDTDLRVTAIFDEDETRRFFGSAVHPVTQLADRGSWSDFDVLLVMSFDDAVRKNAESRLSAVAFPMERIFWI